MLLLPCNDCISENSKRCFLRSHSLAETMLFMNVALGDSINVLWRVCWYSKRILRAHPMSMKWSVWNWKKQSLVVFHDKILYFLLKLSRVSFFIELVSHFVVFTSAFRFRKAKRTSPASQCLILRATSEFFRHEMKFLPHIISGVVRIIWRSGY